MINQLINTTTQIILDCRWGADPEGRSFVVMLELDFQLLVAIDPAYFFGFLDVGYFGGLFERWMSQILEEVLLVISL